MDTSSDAMVMLCSCSMTKHTAFLGLGSNLGDTKAHLEKAIRLIKKKIGNITRQSSFYESKPWGFESEHLFLNAVVAVETTLTPRELLETTQLIEHNMGRRHKTKDGHYTDRTIDIDILLYDDLQVNDPDLIIPHPRMLEREFVMQPLREIQSV